MWMWKPSALLHSGKYLEGNTPARYSDWLFVKEFSQTPVTDRAFRETFLHTHIFMSTLFYDLSFKRIVSWYLIFRNSKLVNNPHANDLLFPSWQLISQNLFAFSSYAKYLWNACLSEIIPFVVLCVVLKHKRTAEPGALPPTKHCFWFQSSPFRKWQIYKNLLLIKFRGMSTEGTDL